MVGHRGRLGGGPVDLGFAFIARFCSGSQIEREEFLSIQTGVLCTSGHVQRHVRADL